MAGSGTLGTPTQLLDEAPPGLDQEGNWVVSGVGLVGPGDGVPDDAARRSPSASSPRRRS